MARTEPMGLRFERDAAQLGREWVEASPALLFPIQSAVLELTVGGRALRLDSAHFALVPARAPYRLEALGSVAPTVILLVGPLARAAAAKEYAPHFEDALYAKVVAAPRLFPRTRWVDELVQRYLFERKVCERHGSAAARFLETELTKELFFLGKEALSQHTRMAHVGDASDLVKAARDWLEARLFEPLRIAELARACHASESTLLRAFRRELGAPPAVYLRQRRLDEALLLLESGRYSATEVALRVGYATLPAFTVAFQRRFGLPPSRVGKERPGAQVLPPHGEVPRRPRARSRRLRESAG